MTDIRSNDFFAPLFVPKRLTCIVCVPMSVCVCVNVYKTICNRFIALKWYFSFGLSRLRGFRNQCYGQLNNKSATRLEGTMYIAVHRSQRDLHSANGNIPSVKKIRTQTAIFTQGRRGEDCFLEYLYGLRKNIEKEVIFPWNQKPLSG